MGLVIMAPAQPLSVAPPAQGPLGLFQSRRGERRGVVEKTARLALSEFRNFVKLRDTMRYLRIVHAAEGATRSEVRYLKIREGSVNDAEPVAQVAG